MLEEIASNIEAYLDDELTLREEHSGNYTCDAACRYAEIRVHVIMTYLRSKSLWPVSELGHRPLKEIWHDLETVDLSTSIVANDQRFLRCDGNEDRTCIAEKARKVDLIQCKFVEYAAQGRRALRAICHGCLREHKVVESGCEHRAKKRKSC